MAFFEIPLSPRPQAFDIALGPKTYNLRFYYNPTSWGPGWNMDISDDVGNPLICGIPLLTGVDLLTAYKYVGIPGKLWVATDGDPDADPTETNLGITSHLYFETT